MPQQLINRSPDLKKLRDEGFEIEVCDAYLIVHHIPYVNQNREVKYGKLIAGLSISNDIVMAPNTHVIHFAGEYPCYKDGTPIESIRNVVNNNRLPNGIVMNYSFSNKPKSGVYKDHYEQVSRYAEVIASNAIALDPTAIVKTFKVVECGDDSVFQYADTHESRANIAQINNKIRGQKIAIIGLGGTGSYILDMVSKCPVAEIHLYDDDFFLQHNAFRAPGAPSKEELSERPSKVEYFSGRYSNMHKRVIPHKVRVNDENIKEFFDMTYVFICVDSDGVRRSIISNLLRMGISFTDAGLGVNVVDTQLIGTVRLTSGAPEKYDHVDKRIGVGGNEDAENEYATNIQIADLNALNAVLSVIKWKKWCGYYQDLVQELHTTYTINDGNLLNEDSNT